MLIKSDYLVIGSGVAGLSFALKAARHGSVIVLCKRQLDDTNTNLAQGGIAAVLGQDDRLSFHVQDTLEAGCGLCRLEAVQTVVEEGPALVRELANMGVPFTASLQDPQQPHLGQEGGHSRRRVIHAKDMTGHAVQSILIKSVEDEPNIKVYQFHQALDLIVSPDSCRVAGAYVLDIETERLITFAAKAVILATGGSGKVYLYTTNPEGASGDGLAMGFRAGASVANMEFIQFHPTCLYHPLARNFLISEALRGEGGQLVNHTGRPFMDKYHPLGDLAFRDVVARAIDQEMKQSGSECVYLDITHLKPDFIKDRFPHIYATCLSLGIDICTQPIPVVPAAHYQCGGLVTDLDGRTDIDGLYAVGEVACTGLHGANRLASNSLLEGLVMAHRAAETLGRQSAHLPQPRLTGPSPWPSGRLGHAPREAVVIAHSWDEIRRFMWNYVGIVRSEARLRMAAARLALVKGEIDEFFRFQEVDADLIEVRNIAQVAELIINCALKRRESRGLNYNLDWPERDDLNFQRDTILGPRAAKA